MVDLSVEEMRERIQALEEQVHPTSYSPRGPMPLGSADDPADPVRTSFLGLVEQENEPDGEQDVRPIYIDTNGNVKKVNEDGSTDTIGGGGPSDAEYVVLSTDPELDNDATHSSLTGADLHDPSPHVGSHQDGGTDELAVESLASAAANGKIPVAQGDGSVAMETVSTDTTIDLIQVAKKADLPDPANVTSPTIAYIENDDDYAGVFQQ